VDRKLKLIVVKTLTFEAGKTLLF